MSATSIDQITGFSGSQAIKQPVATGTSGPIALTGLQVVGGIALAEGNRVLVKSQADARQNGIWIASTGDWQRAADFDGTGKAVQGTLVLVVAGTQVGLWSITSADPIEFETSTIDFSTVTLLLSLASGIAFTPAGNIAATNVQAAIQELDTEKVAKAGDTMTGSLTIAHGGSPRLVLNKSASGGDTYIAAQTAGVTRWHMLMGNGIAESGGNAGSDFSLDRYSDAGGYLGAVLNISRASGLITLGSGQLKFPATQNPSTDANTLDDYEEGTWTPTLRFGGNSVGMTYSTQTGTYVKVGRHVTIGGNITLSAKGSSTGAATIGGLPFAAGGTINDRWGINAGHMNAATWASLTAGLDINLAGTEVAMSLRVPGTTGQSGNATESNATNTSSIGFGGSYLAAA